MDKYNALYLYNICCEAQFSHSRYNHCSRINKINAPNQYRPLDKTTIFVEKFTGRMLEKTLGIVLHIIPYNDKISVAHLYTEQYGRSSYLIPQGGGKKARMFRSLFMPFSILELDIDYRNSRELQKIIEAHGFTSSKHLFRSGKKCRSALFIRSPLSNHKRTRTQSPAFRLHRPFHSSPQYNGRR